MYETHVPVRDSSAEIAALGEEDQKRGNYIIGGLDEFAVEDTEDVQWMLRDIASRGIESEFRRLYGHCKSNTEMPHSHERDICTLDDRATQVYQCANCAYEALMSNRDYSPGP